MGGLFRPLVAGPAKHLLRLARDREYRALARLESALGRSPRRAARRARVHGWTLEIPDAASFLESYREIFVERCYDFPWEGAPPRILDLGANIGLSVLRFELRHPGARIVALEPDPAIFAHLERNVHGNGFGDVELVNRAAWNAAGTVSFRADGADGGRVAPGAGGGSEVQALDLAAFLAERRFDAIKMDIEGAEAVVLPACRDALASVRFLAVEYHSVAGRPQALHELLRVFESCGFRVQVRSVLDSPAPFLERRVHAGYDMLLHLSGWKP
jgi:FkbM family methyltransferase